MFSIGDGTKFWLYTKPTDMRKNFKMLSRIVNSHTTWDRTCTVVNMMKLLRYEPGGLVIYNKRLDHGLMHLVERAQAGDPSITPL